jgi:fructoselysine transporter
MKREISLLQATSINMIDMVGIGPFVTLSIVISTVGSNLFIWAWVFGAVTALIDGMIWSELGAAYPLAGGSYNFLKEAYGGKGGRLMSFLFVWQTCLQSSMVVASGAIGFAQYFNYLMPLGFWWEKVVSGSLVVVITALLYRNIRTIGKMAVFLWAGVIIIILWIIISGFTHRQVGYSCLPSGGQSMFSTAFGLLIGQASVKTIYSYLGYYNVCHLGGEIRDPGRNIPRSIFISIFCIAALYLSMNLSVVGVIPWREAMGSKFVVSLFMERIYGSHTAQIATLLILWIAFASLFAVVLGYSRVPYAAAADGNFFPIFARLHSRKDFPCIIVVCRRAWIRVQPIAEAAGGDQRNSRYADPRAVRGPGGRGRVIKKAKRDRQPAIQDVAVPLAGCAFSGDLAVRSLFDRACRLAGSVSDCLRSYRILCVQGEF